MKWTVRRKLFFSFASILTFLFIVGGMGAWTNDKINREYEFLLDDRVHKVNLIDKLIQLQKDEVSAVRGFLLYEDNAFLQELEVINKNFHETYTTIRDIVTRPNVIQLTDELLERQNAYISLSEEAIELKLAQDEKFRSIAEEASIQSEGITKIAEEIKALQVEITNETRQELEQLVKKTKVVTSSLIALALVGGILLAVLISLNIARPVRTMTQQLEEVSTGNLMVEPINIKNKDEIGDMATAFNKMTTDLNTTIATVSASSVELAAQSEQLSASSEESLAASQMVAAVAETSMNANEQQTQIVNDSVLAMNEMTTGILQIAERNEDMLASTELVTNLIEQGAEIVDHVSAQMENIHTTIHNTSGQIQVMAQHSEEIQKVTTLITSIAEQTNLLALNAAIEAARAGEHGNGFAVVAEEVRELAERSKNATEEIATMVSVIQSDATDAVDSIEIGNTKVNEGLSASARSLEVFNDIKEAITNTGSSVETVSAAIEEIQAMATEVATGAERVKGLAEASMANSEETSAATEEQLATAEQISSSNQQLAILAENLQVEVNRFKTT